MGRACCLCAFELFAGVQSTRVLSVVAVAFRAPFSLFDADRVPMMGAYAFTMKGDGGDGI